MPEHDATDATPVCVIGGTGRSGTSLMSRIFGHHPQVARLPESRFLVDPDGILDFLGVVDHWSPYHFHVRLERLAELLDLVRTRDRAAVPFARLARSPLGSVLPRRFQRPYASVGAVEHFPRFDERTAELLDDLAAFRYEGEWIGMPRLARREMAYAGPDDLDAIVDALTRFVNGLVGDAVEAQGATHYLEKNTWNILWFDRMLTVLPQARLVHIVRDPRDTLASLMRQNWAPSDLDDCLRFLLDLHQRWIAVHESVDAGAVLEIRFEDLVSDPATTLRGVCDHWALEWSDAVLAENLARPNSGRWRRDIDEHEHDRVTAAVQPVLDRYGYSAD